MFFLFTIIINIMSFGMNHDESPNCPTQDDIMAATGSGSPSLRFSTCSCTFLETYFNTVYAQLGACLEPQNTFATFGDPVTTKLFFKLFSFFLLLCRYKLRHFNPS